MLQFPETFNRSNCYDKIKTNQQILLNTTRESFYKKINDHIEICKSCIELEFPANMWDSNKRQLATEILERFDHYEITFEQAKCTITRKVDDVEKIPCGILRVVIQFKE